jgi:hypothetical protein
VVLCVFLGGGGGLWDAGMPDVSCAPPRMQTVSEDIEVVLPGLGRAVPEGTAFTAALQLPAAHRWVGGRAGGAGMRLLAQQRTALQALQGPARQAASIPWPHCVTLSAAGRPWQPLC